jgi:maleate isomerase
MYGWRGRVAHLSPSRGDVLVHEFYRVAPEGVMLINTTGTVRRLRDGDLAARLASLETAACDVAAERVDFVVAGGGPLVTMQGYGAERRIAEQLTQASGVPCITAIEIEMEALRAAGCRRPVLATPYPPALDERLVRYLRDAGFDVQGCIGLGMENNSEIGALPEHASLHVGRRAVASAPNADGVFMPCSRWPTLATIQLLEQQAGMPVVSAALAVIYGALVRFGVRGDFARFGSLLGSLAPRSIQPAASAALVNGHGG